MVTIKELTNDYDNAVGFAEKLTMWKLKKKKKSQRKIKKEKERKVYGDNGCIRRALEGVPLVIIVTSRNEAQGSSIHKAYIHNLRWF